MAAAKPGVTDIYTDSFQGDTGALLLLLEQAGQMRLERCLLASLVSGEDHSQLPVLAKLETWPPGNSF